MNAPALAASAALLLALTAALALWAGWQARRAAVAGRLLSRMMVIAAASPAERVHRTAARGPARFWRASILGEKLRHSLEERMLQARVRLSPAAALGITAAMFACGALGAALTVGPGLWSVGAGACCTLLPLGYVNLRRRRRLVAFAAQLPYALDVIKAALQAGHPWARAVQTVAAEFAPPLGAEFATVVHQTQVGMPVPEALRELVHRVPAEEVRLLAVAVRVNSEVGSSLASIMGHLAELVRSRQRFAAQVRALTAQARFSAGVVALLPVLVLAALSLLEPGYAALLFSDPTGLQVLKAALALDLLALLVIARIISVRF